MANTLGHDVFNAQYWAREMQQIFFKENRAIALANTELRELLSDGDVVHKPYRSHLIAQTYTKGDDITVQDVSGADETLTVDTAKVVPFYIDDIDKIQNKWDMASKFAGDAGRVLSNLLDQAVLAEYTEANTDIWNDDVGGSGTTTAIPLTTSNVYNIFTAAGRNLDYLNMPSGNRFAVLSPRALETLRLSVAGRETGFGDTVGANGIVGSRFGFNIYESNNTPFTATWTPAGNPTDGDTITIAGVTFTFRTTLGATAGSVHIGTATANTLTNLVNAINAPRTAIADDTETGYIVVSDADAWKLTSAGIVATDGTTDIDIAAYGDITVAASEAADPWTVQIQHLLFGVKGATDLLVQKSPNVEFRTAEKRLGRYVYPWVLYGVHTFADMKDALVDVNIDASSWN